MSRFYSKYKNLLKESYDDFVQYMEKPLRKSIRVNTGRISIEDFKKYAKFKGWKLTQIPWIKSGFFVDRDDKSVAIGKDLLHVLGYFYIQEASSMLPPIALDIDKNDVILDMCASPGSKTTQISNMMDDTNVLIANEVSIKRMSALVYNVENQLAINTVITNIDAKRIGNNFAEIFDKILLDAPCSSEGVYRKDKKVADICVNPKVCQKMQNTQISLIQSAINALKVGGKLVYSTCTLTLEENEKVIEFAVNKYKDKIKVVKPNIKKCKYDEIYPNTMRIWPHLNDTEGFFVASIIKTDNTFDYNKKINSSNLYISKISQKIKPLSKFEKQDIIYYIFKLFEIPKELFDKYIFLTNGVEISIIPEKSYYFTNKYKIYNPGYTICKISNKGGIFITHLFTQIFGQYANKNIVKLEEDEALSYILGNDIYKELYFENNFEKQLILYTDIKPINKKIVIGKGIYVPSEKRIKNQFPRNKIFL